MKKATPPVPSERDTTVRQAILRELEAGPATSRDLSQLVKIREKEVASHLEHLEKSLKHAGKELVIEPAECLICGFVFKDRKRHQRPSACPECRNSRIHPPRFFVRESSRPGRS